MNCFNNNRPKLSSSERTQNMNAKTLFKANTRSFQQSSIRNKCKNYSGKVGFYSNGLLRNTRSFNTKNLIQRGYSLCADGAYTKKCNQPNLERDSGIGQNLQRGLYNCPKTNYLDSSPVKLTLGNDSIFNSFKASGVNSTLGCNPLSGFRVMESWESGLVANLSGSPPWNNVFGCEPREDWLWKTPTIPNRDPDGNSAFYPLSKVVIDPDNSLFGTNFCPEQLEPGQGPLKYLDHTKTSSYAIVQGQIFDPTGTHYDLNGCTGYIGGVTGQALPCKYSGTVDCCGNEIRLPKRGDLAISGACSILDIHSNISQLQNFSFENFINAWGVIPVDTEYNISFLEIINQIIAAGGGPTSSHKSKESIISDVATHLRKYLLTVSWAFQWFSGAGMVDSVCCIDPDKKIFRVIVKTFFGGIYPPEQLPASEYLVSSQFNNGSYLGAVNGTTWRGRKNGPQGLDLKVGGYHMRGSTGDLFYMSGGGTGYTANIGQAGLVEYPAVFSGSKYINELSKFPCITCVGITGACPIGQNTTYGVNTTPGVSAANVSTLEHAELYMGVGSGSSPFYYMPVSAEALQWIGATDYLPNPPAPLTYFKQGKYCNSTAYLLERKTIPGGFDLGPPVPLLGPDRTFKVPSSWLKKNPNFNTHLWIINLNIFAGNKPGKRTESGILPWGGGIAFISQGELGAFFQKLLGSGLAPLSLMGWQNQGKLRWGGLKDLYTHQGLTGSTGANAGILPSMATNAACIFPSGNDTASGKFSSDLRRNQGTGSTTGYGVWVLKDLYKKPYSVQLSSGSCGTRNLGFGNNTKQNYMVSYDNNGGNVNFAINQKLYTNFSNKSS